MPSTKPETVGFLNLPAEIRTQIYTYFIDKAAHKFGDDIIRYPKARARSKSRLLLVNKLIYSEALPVFYKHHHFCLAVQNLFSPPPSPTLAEESRFDLLVYLELVYEDRIDKLDVPSSDGSISHHLRFVQARCLNLKYLRLELRSRRQTIFFPHHRYRSQRYPVNPFTPSSSSLISPSNTGNASRIRLSIPPILNTTSGVSTLSSMPLVSTNHLGIQAGFTPMMAGMAPGPTQPMVSGHCIPGTTPRFAIQPLSKHIRPEIFLIFNMRPALRTIPGTNPPPPPPLMIQPRNIPIGTYFIDREGASVKCLRELWGRLEKLTIVVPQIGDFGEVGFQQYMCNHLGEVVAPGVEWDVRTVDYEGESMSMRGARLVEWSVSKEIHRGLKR